MDVDVTLYLYPSLPFLGLIAVSFGTDFIEKTNNLVEHSPSPIEYVYWGVGQSKED